MRYYRYYIMNTKPSTQLKVRKRYTRIHSYINVNQMFIVGINISQTKSTTKKSFVRPPAVTDFTKSVGGRFESIKQC